MRQLLLAGTLAVFVTGCAGPRMRRENAIALAAADARVLEGCYDCLLEARAAYDRLAKSRHIVRDTVLLHLFETQVLVALREKELQLDWRSALDSARVLGALVRTMVDAERVLTIADAVLPDGTGRMNDWPVALRRRIAPMIPRVPAEVEWLARTRLREPVRQYLALALDCSHGGRVLAPRKPPGAPHRRPILAPGASPLVMYRTAICLGADTVMLQAARAHVPDFPEAAYYMASLASFMAEETGGTDAATLFADARARFPESPAIAYMSGWLASNVDDCAGAVGFFDASIAIDSLHEMAWLQRTKCLSTLTLDTAAVASATRLIALGTHLAGQGHYWRAVSQLRLRNLPAARADIEVAKRLEPGPNSFTVAGIIEHDQGDLAMAETDLKAARAELRGDENCTAAWYLGLVYAKQPRAPDAAAGFEAAMRCYDVKVADARYRIEMLEARPTRYPEVRARRIAALVADTLDNRSRYFASAFNAAGHSANAGDLPRAIQLINVAAADPKLADPVARLRAAIAAAR